MSDQLTLFLLTIRGTLAPATLEDARNVHNQTAGNPAGVAGAQGHDGPFDGCGGAGMINPSQSI